MQNAVNPWRVLVKGLLLFFIMEFALVWLIPDVQIPNLYAAFHIKRQRFPLSTVTPADDALDVGNLDAMLFAHIVSNPKAANEYRVLVFGDSAAWGIRLTPEQTISGQLDALKMTCGSKDVKFYNLSFPRSSATKDMMILDKAMAYEPDLIVWFVTWYTLMPKTRVDHWLITQNPAEFYRLGHRFDFLPHEFTPPTLFDTVLARNRSLFRETRFQLYSLMQLATGLDQIPGKPDKLPAKLSTDVTFEGLKPPTLRIEQVSLDQVQDFHVLAGKTPVLLINEPILIVSGTPNSDVRYNSYYPRWVYDQYRTYLGEAALKQHWNYLDLWDTFPATDFTGTPLHLKPEGQHLLALTLEPTLKKACP